MDRLEGKQPFEVISPFLMEYMLASKIYYVIAMIISGFWMIKVFTYVSLVCNINHIIFGKKFRKNI